MPPVHRLLHITLDTTGAATVLRVPAGALALSSEHQPDGEVYAGGEKGDEGAGP